MKARLNITIEESLLERAKVYAMKKRVSLSSLVGDYLEAIVHASPRRKTIVDMVDKLEPDPEVIAESSRQAAFYESQKEKYGF
ncbi:DUF6364 family protein [Compostibacter hankyongensis]|uniref:Antitoxin n=1 Tax=Compostibacter hankyongensis TaxID=1007089 RepID=A0ABP8FG08_9BACT